jgi:four helix bundle protein
MRSPEQFEKRFLDFGASVLRLSSCLPKSQTGRHIADQLLRSGTSVGAHMREARSAESKADLIHKMQIALKEAREAHYWLSLIQQGGLIHEASLTMLVQEAHELTAILAQSVITAKRNLDLAKAINR